MLFVRRRFEGTSELFEVVAVGDSDMINDGRFQQEDIFFSDSAEHVRTETSSHDLHQHLNVGNLQDLVVSWEQSSSCRIFSRIIGTT